MKKILVAAVAALLSWAAVAATLNPVQLLNPAGSTNGQAIISTGPSTPPTWASVSFGILPTVAANTVLANATGAVGIVGAVAVPSCSTAGSVLHWAAGVGFSCATNYALTTNPMSQFATTTSAQLAGVLSDETGTGSAVFGTTPTIVTPNIVGITNGSSAAAGAVGELRSSNVASGSAIPITTAVAKDITSISLTAGEWDVNGTVCFSPAAATTSGFSAGWISTTSALIPSAPNGGAIFVLTSSINVGQGSWCMPTGTQTVNVAATTTMFLSAETTFGTSTNSVFGFIRARRVR